MADIFHGKCNLQCPALRLKSNRLSLLIYLTEANRKGGGEVRAPFLGQFSNGPESLEVILAMPLPQTKRCPAHSTYKCSTQESLTLLMAKRRAVGLT